MRKDRRSKPRGIREGFMGRTSGARYGYCATMNKDLKGVRMTLAEAIAKKSAALPPESQRQVLRFVEGLRPKRKVRPVGSKRKPRGLPPSLKAAYGIWADRSD